MNVFSFSSPANRTNNANNATHYVKLGKKRRDGSKRNYCIMSPRVISKAIIIIICLASLFSDGLAHSSYLRACSIVGVRAQNSHCQLLLTPMHLTSADCCHLRPRPTCPIDRVLFPHAGA